MNIFEYKTGLRNKFAVMDCGSATTFWYGDGGSANAGVVIYHGNGIVKVPEDCEEELKKSQRYRLGQRYD